MQRGLGKRENFVQAVTENIPPMPSTALSWTEKQKASADTSTALLISHSSAIPLYLDVVKVIFKCLWGKCVYMEHDDCHGDFVQVEARGFLFHWGYVKHLSAKGRSLLCCFLSCLTNSCCCSRACSFTQEISSTHARTHLQHTQAHTDTQLWAPLHVLKRYGQALHVFTRERIFYFLNCWST